MNYTKLRATKIIFCSILIISAFLTISTLFRINTISHQYDDYEIRFGFSGVEPSFVYVFVNNENRYGGLWGIIDDVRTIDFNVFHNPRLLSHEETATSPKQCYVITDLDIGRRTATFSSHKNVLTMQTKYELTKSVVVTDFYWEQINMYGVDKNATVAIGYADGSVEHYTWHVDDFGNAVWIWIKYIEWFNVPRHTHQMLFTTYQPATIQLREEHGNDVLFTRTHSNATFTTEVYFDVPCPL